MNLAKLTISCFANFLRIARKILRNFRKNTKLNIFSDVVMIDVVRADVVKVEVRVDI